MIIIPQELEECLDYSCSRCGARNTNYCLYPGKAKHEGMTA